MTDGKIIRFPNKNKPLFIKNGLMENALHEAYKLTWDGTDYNLTDDNVQENLMIEFVRFHFLNEHVYEMFSTFADYVFQSNRKYYGANCIIERMRWEYDFETNTQAFTDRYGDEKEKGFKLSANLVTYYARLYICENCCNEKDKRPFVLKSIAFENEFDDWLAWYFDTPGYESRPEIPRDIKEAQSQGVHAL